MKSKILLILFFLYTNYSVANDINENTIYVHTDFYDFIVDLAITNEDKKKGLMNIKSLSNTNGMLFIYNKPQILRMWMKNTYLKLDIIFIDENHFVSSIEKGKKFSKDILSSKKPVIAVLEILSTCNKKIGIKIGDKISWSYFEKDNLIKTKNHIDKCS